MNITTKPAPIRHLLCNSSKELKSDCILDIIHPINSRSNGVCNLPIDIWVFGKGDDLLLILLTDVHLFKLFFSYFNRVAFHIDIKNSGFRSVRIPLNRAEDSIDNYPVTRCRSATDIINHIKIYGLRLFTATKSLR
ncbi:MAG: hypothetical protein BWY45_01868 [Euryarchaeota archaeon ADurb.Bin294]|nr:MAG: hypothetical protein BWY45_01868 [Euryarchaeota archaeon ADurb.Bin294]